MKTLVLTFSLVVSLMTQLNKAELWKEEKNENGIVVYTRLVNGSDYKEFKGVMELDAKLTSLVAVLNDPENFKFWVYNCECNKLLKGANQKEQFHYMETYAPFPVDNRDLVYHYSFSQDPISKEITVKIEGLPDYVPVNKGKVRMKKAAGFWKLTPVDNNKIKIIYQLHVEPGGSLPAVLANQYVVDTPFYTLLKFRETLKDKKYSNVKFEFVKD